MKLDPEIARDSVESVELVHRRSLEPVLKDLRKEGYRLVGLEQTTDSHDMHQFTFDRRTALVIGNERTGLTDEVLALLDATVEIPVWGLPHSYNAATATCMALYEYCRQFPDG
jgi:tRNA G18 (ribose-2'-O)-methylase SpoU